MAEKKETKKTTGAQKPKKAKEVEPVEMHIKADNVVDKLDVEVEVKQEPEEVKVENVEEEVSTDTEMFEKPEEPVKSAEPEIPEDVKTVIETTQKLEESKEELNTKLAEAETEDEAKEVINKELEKVQDMTNKVKKIIKKYSNGQISNSWNGMIQDW